MVYENKLSGNMFIRPVINKFTFYQVAFERAKIHSNRSTKNSNSLPNIWELFVLILTFPIYFHLKMDSLQEMIIYY